MCISCRSGPTGGPWVPGSVRGSPRGFAICLIAELLIAPHFMLVSFWGFFWAMSFSAVGCQAGNPLASMGQRGFASLWARIDGTVGVPMWNLEICLTCRVGLLQGFLLCLACECFLFFEVELSLAWRAGHAACPSGYKLRCSGSHFSNSSRSS